MGSFVLLPMFGRNRFVDEQETPCMPFQSLMPLKRKCLNEYVSSDCTSELLSALISCYAPVGSKVKDEIADNNARLGLCKGVGLAGF